MGKKIIYIDGKTLDMDTIVEVMDFQNVEVRLGDQARNKCMKTRRQIDNWLHGDSPVIYGINTGLGNLKDTVLSPEEHKRWNKTIPYPVSLGLGNVLDEDVARATLLVRANVLARGYSAARVDLIDRILDLFNSGIVPVIYELGSTGLSDLSPLAQLAMFISGLEEAQAIYGGQMMQAREAFKKSGLDPIFELECKESLSLMNGSSMTQALSVLTFKDLERLFNRHSLDLKNDNISLYESMANTLDFIKFNLNKENNVSCDNPLLFQTGKESYEAIMGCNCSNTQIGYVMDLVAILVSDLSKWVYRKKGGDIGIIGQIDQLQIPATSDSIATKANQEDHVEFSYGAARKARNAVVLLGRLS